MLLLVGFVLILGYALMVRPGIARMDASQFPPEQAQNFARWKQLKLRRIDLIIGTMVLVLGGITLAVKTESWGDRVGPFVGIGFWVGLIWSIVLARKAAKLEQELAASRKTAVTE